MKDNKNQSYIPGILIAALLMSLAPAMDLSVARVARPATEDFWGYIYQIIARTLRSIQMEPVMLAILFIACLWLCKRYLFHKPEEAGLLEYALCLILSVAWLLAMTVRLHDTVAILWQNAFQLIKTAICASGLYLFLLTLLRGLKECLDAFAHFRARGLLGRLNESINRHPFAAPFLLLLIVWLPQIIARYPGVIMWDSYIQLNDFLNQSVSNHHPVFGTLIFGMLGKLGVDYGCKNIVFFAFTLLQSLAMLVVLSHSLLVMKRIRVPVAMRLAAFMIYAISPCYISWITTISKDTLYLLAYMAMLSLLLSFLFDRERFLKGPWHLLALGASMTLLCLIRHNGMPIALCVVAAMLFALKSPRKKDFWRVVCCGVLTVVFVTCTNAGVDKLLNVHHITLTDQYSAPFQMTARVVKLHGDELPADEVAAIDAILDYGAMAENYDPTIADPVKSTIKQPVLPESINAYFSVFFKQLLRYPMDYLDAYLHMYGILFDLQANEPMYVSLSDMTLHNYVYPWSMNDLSIYEREALVPLNGVQRVLTEWHMNFDRLPLIGMICRMSFHTVLLLMLLYLCFAKRRWNALLLVLPGLLTLGVCMLAPVAYLRYALPYICAMPISIAAYYANGVIKDEQQLEKGC